MINLKPYAKALGPYWLARQVHARRKYAKAAAVLKGLPAASEDLSGKVTLIFSSMGVFADHLVVDSMLARSLERQGAKVLVVLCDAQLSACHVTDHYAEWGAIGASGRAQRQKRLCRNCVASGNRLEDSGLALARFSEGLAHAETVGLLAPDIDVSDEVNSGVIRYAASSHPSVLDKLPADVRVRYQASAATALRAIDGLMQKYRPSHVIAHHGIYLPQGIVQKLARHHGADFYSWHFGYRKSTLIFSRGDTYHRELTAAQPTAFETALSPDEAARISGYLKSRAKGSEDWIHFNRQPKPFEAGSQRRGYFVFYTSVDWDAALHFPSSVFRSQFECLSQLIEIFRTTPDYELIIRVHPAEVSGFHPAAFSIEDHLNTLSMPDNVRVIAARDPTSSYDLARDCVAAIVYNTKLGIELPPIGIPTIVTGDCWIRGKGFSYDVETLDDLKRFVEKGPELVVTQSQRARALQFAHYFYWRRCIDTPELVSSGPKFQISLDAEAAAASQRDGRGFAFIARQILAGQNVEKPA
jgi:hypothetical protein